MELASRGHGDIGVGLGLGGRLGLRLRSKNNTADVFMEYCSRNARKTSGSSSWDFFEMMVEILMIDEMG